MNKILISGCLEGPAKRYNEVGPLYHQLGKFEEAEREFREAIQIDPNYAIAHNNLGILYKSKKFIYKNSKI